MAIARGVGTEIIRSAHFEDVDSSSKILIFGVQHHIYTVLSVVAKCVNLQAAGNQGFMYLQGYDSVAGTTAQPLHILEYDLVAGETFVWNDKFSFNGHEPTDFTGPMDSIVKQDAVADQGSSVAQKLYWYTTHADDGCDVLVTYIDQNNA